MKTSSKNQQDVKDDIEQALKDNRRLFEEIVAEDASPLNQPVVDKSKPIAEHQPIAYNVPDDDADTAAEDSEDGSISLESMMDDVPEQEIGTPGEEPIAGGEGIEIPLSHAQMTADTLLGITDNFLEIGGGYLISLKKHKDFYDIDEIVEVIDEQNTRNIKRLKLEDDDKALLRPLLVVIIRKRSKALTPEQQLLGAIIAILMKKAKLVMQIRAENEILVERIRDIVQDELTKSTAPAQEESKHVDNNVSAALEVSE